MSPGERFKGSHREINYIEDILEFKKSIDLELEVVDELNKKSLTVDDHYRFQLAVKSITHDLERISEGVRRIPREWRDEQTFEFARFISTRNTMVHEYPSVLDETILNDARNFLPSIIEGVLYRKKLLESQGLDKGSDQSGKQSRQPKRPNRDEDKSLGKALGMSRDPNSENDD